MSTSPKRPRKAPAQSRFTPEVQQKILNAISIGSPLMLAPLAAGIAYTTFRKWIRTGEEQGKGPYYEFAQKVKEAEGAAVSVWLAVIEKAARSGNWTAAAWKLERRYPELFGRTSVRVDHDVHSEIKNLDDKSLEERIRALIKRVGLPGLIQGAENATQKPENKSATS